MKFDNFIRQAIQEYRKSPLNSWLKRYETEKLKPMLAWVSRFEREQRRFVFR